VADNEIRLISKIVREEDVKPALDRGVEASWFVNPQAKMMWQTIIDHWQKYQRVPTPVTLKDILPGCTILKVDEAYDYLLDAFCEWRTNGLTTEAIQKAAEAAEQQDFEEARRIMLKSLAAIEDQALAATSNDVDLTRTVDERIALYLSRRENPDGMLGIATGFPTIDRATLGLQAQQLVTIVATPKAGKSTLVEAISKNVWERGGLPLLLSFEMSNDEQSARIDSMIANMAHSKLLSGRIDERDEKRLRLRLERMKEVANGFHLVADPSSTSTVSGVAAKIETYNPDCVFIDGVYLMRDEKTGENGTPQALTNITRSLKRLAQKRHIPIVIATQALTWKLGRGKKVTADSIGYSSSFFQDSDVILGLDYVDEDDDDLNERILKVIASRACPRVETTLQWNWNEGRFEEYEGQAA
jgi:replicative DNA helicase